MKKNQNISFALQGISTRQFAIVKEAYKVKDEILLTHQLNFGFDKEHAMIMVVFNLKFECEGIPFITLEISCEFAIEDSFFKSMWNAKLKQLFIPVGFARHLSVFTVGTARGVLHSKLENTDFKQFFLPAVNVHEFVQENIVLQR